MGCVHHGQGETQFIAVEEQGHVVPGCCIANVSAVIITLTGITKNSISDCLQCNHQTDDVHDPPPRMIIDVRVAA